MSETRWLSISAGRGPAECAWVVARLTQHLLDASCDEVEVRRLDEVAGREKNTAQSVVLELIGDGAAAFAERWSGTVQWIGASMFRPHHRRKNWFVGVTELAPPPEVPTFEMSDLRVDVYRGSGPGGQHRNKVSSAVRVTHLPTGAVAQAEEERSQIANKKRALQRLSQCLEARRQEAIEETERSKWQQHDNLERGNASHVFNGARFRYQSRVE